MGTYCISYAHRAQHRSIAPDGDRLGQFARALLGVTVVVLERLAAVFCVDHPILVVFVLIIFSLLMASTIKTAVGKRVLLTLSRDPLLDASMDNDDAPPRSPSPSSTSKRLPFPGKVVDGVHEVEYREV